MLIYKTISVLIQIRYIICIGRIHDHVLRIRGFSLPYGYMVTSVWFSPFLGQKRVYINHSLDLKQGLCFYESQSFNLRQVYVLLVCNRVQFFANLSETAVTKILNSLVWDIINISKVQQYISILISMPPGYVYDSSGVFCC